MHRRVIGRGPAAAVLAGLILAASAQSAQAAGPGAAGIGDPYFPKAGNGGYDVGHYGLNIAYSPKSRRLQGRRDDRGQGEAGRCRASTSTSTG